jgi:hypothetical protein
MGVSDAYTRQCALYSLDVSPRAAAPPTDNITTDETSGKASGKTSGKTSSKSTRKRGGVAVRWDLDACSSAGVGFGLFKLRMVGHGK